MVRYGAELVFSSEASSITDADIEAIIKKGERDTEALNSKMQQFTDNAKQFTMDGGLSVYEFKVGRRAGGWGKRGTGRALVCAGAQGSCSWAGRVPVELAGCSVCRVVVQERGTCACLCLFIQQDRGVRGPHVPLCLPWRSL